MTFLPGLKFSVAGQRVLLIAADRATLYLTRGGRLSEALQFAPGSAGEAVFARYLTSAAPTPILLLVDVVEEEYRQDTLPKVSARERHAMLSRRFARQFRGTPYWLAIAQGRETTGRRDHRWLLCALTRPEVVAPWVAALRTARVPLMGLHSLPVVSRALLPKLGAKGPNVLLITVQQGGGLRQSFFRDGHLTVSRLAAMPRGGTLSATEQLLSELDKLRRYINSLALIARDSPLEVYVLSHGSLLEDLRHECRDSDTQRFTLVAVPTVARGLRIPGDVATPYSDMLFAQLLLDAPPRAQYAPRDETRDSRVYRAGVGLLVASALLLLGGTLWSTLDFMAAIALKRQALDAAEKAGFYAERFDLGRRGLPPTRVEPAQITPAVELAAALGARRHTPVPWLQTLGQALAAAPTLRLDAVEWLAAGTPDAPIGTAQPAPLAPDPRYWGYHIGIARGEVRPFAGDYRTAIAAVDGLAELLRANAAVYAVEVLEYPINLSSDAVMSGAPTQAGAVTPANFALKIVLGVAHATPVE
ncbi:MAG: hypothetical protein EXR83_14680 [Gammaproteobacteria bacterium]|nr:hypothetical protein [Gammaproteobacteria bacterium]